MQRRADGLVTFLREFAAQPDYPTLILNGTDASMTFPNCALAAFDRQDEEAYYLLFPQACTSAASYMSAIAQALADQLELFQAELAARDLAPLPELPLSVRDARHAPAERLRAAVEYCGEHLPGSDPIVWGLLPTELPAPPAYRALVEPLLARHAVEPWMARHRFILRDRAEQPFLVNELLASKNDRVLVMDLDFSNERHVQELVETVHDREAPADDRMQALFQLAAVDFGFRRLPQALEKYGACFNYFEREGNTTMQSMCLLGAADVMHHAGRAPDALTFYQQALALGIEHKSLPVVQQSTFGAGLSCLELSRDEEAEGYFQYAAESSGKLLNPFAKCDAMEKRGMAEWRLGKLREAIGTWTQGKDLAKQFAYRERAAAMLDLLIAASRRGASERRAAEFEQEKAGLEASAVGPLDGVAS